MNNSTHFLGQLEKEIMDLVWESKEPVTVRLVFESISKKRKIAYTTVMTIMGRLTKKGFLKTNTSGRAYTYQTVLSKDKFLTKISRQLIKSMVSNFGGIAIAHFAEALDRIPIQTRRKLINALKGANE